MTEEETSLSLSLSTFIYEGSFFEQENHLRCTVQGKSELCIFPLAVTLSCKQLSFHRGFLRFRTIIVSVLRLLLLAFL